MPSLLRHAPFISKDLPISTISTKLVEQPQSLTRKLHCPIRKAVQDRVNQAKIKNLNKTINLNWSLQTNLSFAILQSKPKAENPMP